MIKRGKTKIIEAYEEDKVKITFTDFITAGDGAKKDKIEGKGVLNLQLSNMLMTILEQAGIPTHQINILEKNVLIARKLNIYPLEVVVRNIAAGSFSRRYGVEEGINFEEPIVEFFVKDDELHDPPIDANVAVVRNMISRQNLQLLKVRALQVNKTLFEYFKQAGMLLVDFKLEFGYDQQSRIFLADELSADSMRVWDIETREILDKDRFRKDLGDVLVGYHTIINRLEKVDFIPVKSPLYIFVVIEPKRGVNNPAGEVLKRTLYNTGIDVIGNVQMGKTIKIEINDSSGHDWFVKLDQTVNEILTNPLIEQFEYHFLFEE